MVFGRWKRRSTRLRLRCEMRGGGDGMYENDLSFGINEEPSFSLGRIAIFLLIYDSPPAFTASKVPLSSTVPF